MALALDPFRRRADIGHAATSTAQRLVNRLLIGRLG